MRAPHSHLDATPKLYQFILSASIKIRKNGQDCIISTTCYHEYNIEGASGYFNYFGGAAGDPSKGYYSYDIGAWHIVVLNSNCDEVEYGTTSEQNAWLKEDLAASNATCTLAYAPPAIHIKQQR